MASDSIAQTSRGSASEANPNSPSARNIQYEPLGLARSILVVVYIVVAIWYLAWRPSTFNLQAPVFSWIVYSAELFAPPLRPRAG